MLSIGAILKKAYFYTRDHKQLWFFGFFLGFGGAFEFLNLILSRPHHRMHAFVLIPSALILIVLLFLLSAFAKTVVLNTVLKLERKENPAYVLRTPAILLRSSGKYLWKILLIEIIISAALIFMFAWVFVPAERVFSFGYVFRALFLVVAGAGVFMPIFGIFILVKNLSECFVIAYNFPVSKAIKSSFDLFALHWQKALGLLLALFFVFALAVFLSVTLVSAISVLAYTGSILIKSLSVPLFWFVQSLIILIFGFVLIIINSVLNVFMTVSWMIFFLDTIKGNPLPEGSKEPAIKTAPNPA